MFAVLFEVHPKPTRWDAYMGFAKLLRPELEKIEGFVENIRYRSLTREGWLLSLSTWQDEKALVRWRSHGKHHDVQGRGRTEVFLDYHLRVGELTRDSRLPAGEALREQRLDETRAGEATTLTVIDARRPAESIAHSSPDAIAKSMGLDTSAAQPVAWDVFDAVLTPGDLLLLISWKTEADATAFERAARLPEGARSRRIRVVRDYGMYDRREAPQYHREVARP